MNKPKILIVDDKAENLFALDKILQKLDVEVLQARSGNEALGLTLEHELCMAIVDVQMPEMDGYELVDLLRGNEVTISLPVIFVSAIFSDEYHHRKGYDSGAVDFMSKPFIPEILLRNAERISYLKVVRPMEWLGSSIGSSDYQKQYACFFYSHQPPCVRSGRLFP